MDAPELPKSPFEAFEQNGVVNGINGTQRPSTPPNRTGMALTEYSANPQTPSPEKADRVKSVLPEDLLLPDGTPDVRIGKILCSLQGQSDPNLDNSTSASSPRRHPASTKPVK